MHVATAQHTIFMVEFWITINIQIDLQVIL